MAERRRARRIHPVVWLGLFLACLGGAAASLLGGCSDWDPNEPFHHDSPDVDRAIAMLDAGDFASAAEVLEHYLNTGPCKDASIGLPDDVRDKYNGSFDLGLALFGVAEKYGRRFGDEEADGDEPEDPELAEKRRLEIDCAQIITKAIANDTKVPIDLRARAFYLSGNLEFMRREYEQAVAQYDKALALIPGLYPEAGGDEIGRDAAWNRAIALRRIQEQDAGQDAEEDAEEDAEPDAEPDAGEDAEPDAGDDGGDDAGDDGGDDGGEPDAGEDGGDDGGEDGGDGDAGKDAEPDSGDEDPADEEDQPADPDEAEADPRQAQIDRMLDELEQAPTYQEEEAKREAAKAARRPVMEDK